MSEAELKQPFLPRINMIWFFVVVTVVALALGVVRAAEQGRALAAALVFVSLFAVAVAFVSGAFFLVAYLMGATEKAVAGDLTRAGSPFVDGQLPDQVLKPGPSDID